jgi:uncharacterized protein YggE
MSDIIVSVRGEHELRVAPERAVVRLTVTADGPQRGAVVERIAGIAEPLRDELAEQAASGAVAEWSSERISVWSDRPWNADGTQLALVHHGSIGITAEFADTSAASDWVASAGVRDGVRVDGVDWTLTPATRAAREKEAATAAVGVAVARANAYASALGLSTVVPLEVADLGLLARPDAGIPAMPRMMRAAFADAGSGPDLGLRPADIVVSAAVEARFSAR